ncbi:Flp family type IVb pilin [Pseudomonas sp. NPDC099000]|uniref:Flp family type IVb pilin n=1 Tax=Pseudomonas sp. NPDC099000 TaxID=3364488 RepID=UPI00383BD7FE
MSFTKVSQTFKSVTASCKSLVKDTEGASGIEYAIVAAMVAVVIATFSTTIPAAITTVFNSILAAL